MMWIVFLLSAAIVVFTSLQLAQYGDVIAVRTGLGGLFMGTLVVAAVTTLPEILVLWNAIAAGVPALAIGGLLGSNMFNMLILSILDLTNHQQRILRQSSQRYALSATLAVLMITLVVLFIEMDLPFVLRAGPLAIGADSLVLVAMYVLGMSQIRKQSRSLYAAPADQSMEGLPGIWPSVIRFLLAAAVLVVVTPWMVDSANQIAETTGLGATFVGAALLAMVTSMPELVTTISAARIGAVDMAIGNLFGSNSFNMLLLGVVDLFLLNRHLFALIDDSFMLIGLLGLLMTVLALMGNLARIEKRLWLIEADALLLIVVYFGGMAVLYSRGIAP